MVDVVDDPNLRKDAAAQQDADRFRNMFDLPAECRENAARKDNT